MAERLLFFSNTRRRYLSISNSTHRTASLPSPPLPAYRLAADDAKLASEAAISAPATAAATAGARRTINQGLSTSAGGGGGGEDGGGGGGVGHREAAHRAWEAEKKLRRRVEALERRLDERGVELQAAEEQTAKAKVLLER